MCNPFMLQHLLLLNAAYVIINDKTSKSANQITVLRTVSDELLLNMLKEYVTEHQTKDWFMNVIEVIGRYFKGIKSDCKRSPSSNEIKLLLVAHIVGRFQLGTAEILMLDLLAESDAHLIYHLEVLTNTETNAIVESTKKDFSDYKHVDYIINRSFSYFSQYYAAFVLEIIKFKIKQNKWNLDITDFCEDHFGNYITDFTSKFSFVLEKADQVKANVNFRLSNIFEQELSYDGVLESLAEHVNYTRTTIMVFYNIDDIIEAIECCKVSKPDLFTDEGIALFDILKCVKNFKNLRNIYKNLQNEFCIRKIFIECSLLTNYDYFFVKFYEVRDSFTLEEWKSDAVAYRELVTDTVGVVNEYRNTKCGNNDPYGRMSYL